MKTIEIGSVEYQIGQLDAMKQFHVSRRIAPIQVAMGVSISELLGSGKNDDEAMLGATSEVMKLIAKMSDEETEYVLATCLEVVKRKEGEGWAKVYVSKRFMYPIPMQDMVRLAIEVMKENLSGFFSGPLGGAL